MKKVLLLGGTGAIGVYLAKPLLSRGYNVYITSRTKQDSQAVRYLMGNAKDDMFLERVLNEVEPDAIVDFMDYSTNEFSSRLHLLLQVKHYLFLSSYRVFAEESPLTERSPRLLDVCLDKEFLATDEYALHKARCENVLRFSGRRNWTILRPSITYSTNRFQFGCLEANTVCWRSLRGLPVVIPKEMLDKRTILTWGGDVGEMIARLVENKLAHGEDYNLATAESLTWREVAAIYAENIGLRYEMCSLREYEALTSKYQVRYDRMVDRCVDNSKVLKATGLTQNELMPVRDGLRKELWQFKLNEHYRGFNARQNVMIDKLCGLPPPLRVLTAQERHAYLGWRYPLLARSSPLRVVKKILRVIKPK